MKLSKSIRILALSAAMIAALAGCSAASTPSNNANSSSATTSSLSTDAAAAGTTATSAANDTASDTAAFPITMKHAYGETVIESKPARVVTLGWNNADPLLALSIAPVGTSMANFGSVGENGLLPWTSKAFETLGVTPNVFRDLDGFDFEAIAAAKPDVILAVYSGMEEKDYTRLSEIAPTIPFKEIAWMTTWREQTLEVAEAVGLQTQGKELVQNTDQFIADTLAKYPELKDRTAALLYLNPADLSSFYVYREIDPRGSYLKDLGFHFPQAVEDQVTDKNAFFALISSELALDTLRDLDIIITYGDDTTLESLQADAILSQVPAIMDGHVLVLDSTGDLAAAVNPSVLSIPSKLVPFLDAISKVFE